MDEEADRQDQAADGEGAQAGEILLVQLRPGVVLILLHSPHLRPRHPPVFSIQLCLPRNYQLGNRFGHLCGDRIVGKCSFQRSALIRL